MSGWFRKKKEKDRKPKPGSAGKGAEHDVHLLSHQRTLSSSSLEGTRDDIIPSPSSSEQQLTIQQTARTGSTSPSFPSQTSSSVSLNTKDSSTSVKAKKELYESLSKSSTPEKSVSPSRSSFSRPINRSVSSSSTPLHESYKRRGSSAQTSPTKSYRDNNISMLLDMSDLSLSQAKEFKGVVLDLPPLRTSTVKQRDVLAVKNPALGGFGFNLRKSFQPDPDNPDNTILVHLVEPRPSYIGPLMSGDRILEVNGEVVVNSPHERVVDLIKMSGDQVNFKVASVPELIELNERGVFDDSCTYNADLMKKSIKPGAGTLRKKAVQRRQSIGVFQAKTEGQLLSERSMLSRNSHWLIHKNGFSLVQLSDSKDNNLSAHINYVRSQGVHVLVVDTGEYLQVEETDIERVNPPDLDRVEDIIDLMHLNESSVLHVLRQRYGSSLIHTFSGRHLIIINPLRHLSLYSDRVIEMFRGCRKEDMPPHVFASGQQAYYHMVHNQQDQSILLSGVSGSGKTFNARYLLRYLATIGFNDGSHISSAKLDAVQLLLHAFTSASTFLNPQATRCSVLYSLEFDSIGSLTAASARIFLLEKSRVSLRPDGELNFNIFYQLLAGITNDENLKRELLLDSDPGTEEPNQYIEPYSDVQQIESAAIVWDLILNCLNILDISDEEAYGLWSILAAIYHLGYAGVKQGSGRATERFINPGAAARAAVLLGVPHEELAKDIFNPPRGTSSRMSSALTSSLSTSPSISETSSINLSIGSFNISPGTARANRSYSLDAFVMGLYDQAVNSLLYLINRSLQASNKSKGKNLIHILDTPGFQNRETAGASEGSSFDELCMNYTRERLQMLFHDFVFTSEQERYLQEDIDWLFTEFVLSPLSVIDIIDKHVPQRRGAFQGLELNDKKGLLWLLEEESMYPNSSDLTFLEKVNTIYGEEDEYGVVPVKVNIDKAQFTIVHCQRTQPITYDINGWRLKVREHPSTRVVTSLLSESKNSGIASLYHGRGVAGTGHASSYKDPQQSSRLSRHPSFSNPTAGIKKSSLCLKTKFQLDFVIDTLRKTNQWYIVCILCQPSYHLPGAILHPSINNEEAPPIQGHIDVPLVRTQLRQADIIPAARIYKQGYPEHQFFPSFCRKFSSLLGPEEKSSLPLNDKDAVEYILLGLELDKNSFKIGLSQIFFKAGVLSSLDKQVEEKTHDLMVLFQSYCRGWLGRKRREKLELQHAAAHVIQRNIIQHEIINEWSWWKLLQKVKPLLAVWKAEEVVKKKESEIKTLKEKIEKIEEERDILKDSEGRLAEKVNVLTTQLLEAQDTAHHVTELLEQEQIDRRALQEQNQDVTSTEDELIKRNEELQLQIAELTILARIKQSENGGDETETENNSEAVLEKYWETKRELETLRQRISTEYEDQVERLQHAKKVLEKKLADSDAEVEDLRRNLSQARKKGSKFSSELNDLKLMLEAQQNRNEELEKRQRKFDSDINFVKDGASDEKLARERLEREKNLLSADFTLLEEKYKKLKEDHQKLESEKTEIETELLKKGSISTDNEIVSLKKMKRELESKVEELEDEVDDLNIKVDSLQQAKSRLELSQNSLKTQHQKEIEGREEDMEQLKATMNKKIKTIEQQLEEEHESKQQVLKAKRDLERQIGEMQSKMTIDPEVEKKLKKQVKKLKALLQDAQEELEHERETRNHAGAIRGLKTQIEELELRESSAAKAQKRLQSEMEELTAQYDEVTRSKLELEGHLSEVQREKNDLESRLEEDAEEMEELTKKLRQNITQNGHLQQQITELKFQIEDFETNKGIMEAKVNKLQQRINELESDSNKQEVEASEVRVRELEQKLELERSTMKRQETTISRLRSQLERVQSDKAEDSSTKSTDAIKRLQKQLREAREEQQESERKEQEQNKKRRLMETEINELQSLLASSQSDLKSAHKRIEVLQEALDDPGQGEEYSSVDELETSSPRRTRKKMVDSGGDSSVLSERDTAIHISDESSDDDDEYMKRINSRKKQRELTSVAVAAGKDDDDDDEDIDEFLSKLKSKRKTADDSYDKESDEEYYSKRKGLDSDEPVRKKVDWRAALISSDEDEIKPIKSSSRDHLKISSDSDLSDDNNIRKKKDWGLSSDEDKETNKLEKPKRKIYLTESSDDEKTIPKTRNTTVASPKGSIEDSPSRKGVKWDEEQTSGKTNDKSFQSSRQRRARRRSRLSNTGTSPENSPKKSSET